MVDLIVRPRVQMRRTMPPERNFIEAEPLEIAYRRKQLQLDFSEIFG